MAWTPEAEEKLRKLWKQGRTASQIAEEIATIPGPKHDPTPRGLTRNMVIGKARRLGLEARPSPIRYKDNGIT